MKLTQDSWCALARSSPWRWRTLHFTHRDRHGEVEAWVRRPGELLVRDADGSEHRSSGVPYSRSSVTVWFSDDGTPPPESVVRDHVLPHQVEPVLRPDGLVAERPGPFVDYDDPMWGNYRWVAMLDPVELSHHVAVADLRVDQVAGRLVWRASVRAEEGYYARCGGNCCELLWSDVSRRCEFSDPDDAPPARPGRTYPDGYDVALDVETGVVVRCHPIGGDADSPWLEVDIHEVDRDLDALFSAGGRPDRS